MTAQDFRLIADAIARAPISDDARSAIVTSFVQLLADDNTRFDKERFIKACFQIMC